VKRLERNLALARFAFNLEDSVERDQRHAEIRRMRRDAALAPSHDGVQPVVAAAGIAARARIALIAGAGDVVEIRAARTLQEIASDGGGIAQLRRCAGQQRLRHRRKAPGKS
jgi:hypothetical protein